MSKTYFIDAFEDIDKPGRRKGLCVEQIRMRNSQHKMHGKVCFSIDNPIHDDPVDEVFLDPGTLPALIRQLTYALDES